MEDQTQQIQMQVQRELDEIGRTRMPFGRFQGRPLYDLPTEYLAYFAQKGFPQGRLGELMKKVYHTKVDGADAIFTSLRRRSSR